MGRCGKTCLPGGGLCWATPILLLALGLSCADNDAPAGAHEDAPTFILEVVQEVATADISIPELWQPETTPPSLSKVETVLIPDTIKAGHGYSTVQCLGYEAAGSYVGVGPYHIEAPPDVNLVGNKLTSLKAGQYEIACVPEAATAATLAPATLTVVPGDPVILELALSPDKEVYVVKGSVKVAGRTEDAFGNAVEEAPLSGLTLEPKSMGIFSGDKVVFAAEGTGTIRAHADGFPEVKDQIKITVDAGAPVIIISSPARGTALQGTGAVKVTGKIVDSTGLASAALNGAALDVGAGGAFARTISPKFGLNLLKVEAQDTLGNKARLLQSFLFAPGYYPIPNGTPEAQMVPGGVAAWLGHQAFDKENGPDGTSISYVLKEFLLQLDLAALIPNPASQQVIVGCTYDIYLENLTYGEPTLKILPAPGGLTMHVEFPELSADLDAPSPGLCPDLSGKVTAAAVLLDAMASLSIGPGGKLQVSLTSIQVQFVNLNIDMYGITGAIADAVLLFFLDDLTAMMEEQFETEIKTQVEEKLLALLGNVTVEQWLDLPPFVPGAKSTMAKIRLEAVDLEAGYGGLEFTMDSGFTADDVKKLDLPGPPIRGGCLKGQGIAVAVEGLHYMEIAMHEDVLAQSAYAKFLAGGVDFVLDGDDLAGMGSDPGEMGIEDLTILGSARLPPILTSCTPDGELHVELGELKLDISLTVMKMPLSMTVYFYFGARVSLAATGPVGSQYIELSFGDVDWADFHLEPLGDDWAGSEELFADMIEESFLPQFIETVKTYPYAVSISSLPVGDLLPAFAGWTFVPVVDDVVQKTGYVLVRAHLLVEE